MAVLLPQDSKSLSSLEPAIVQARNVAALAGAVKWVMLFGEVKVPALNCEEFNLRELLREVRLHAPAFGSMSSTREVQQQVRVWPGVFSRPMEGRHQALTRVLTHLMSSGVKFTVRGFVQLNVSACGSRRPSPLPVGSASSPPSLAPPRPSPSFCLLGRATAAGGPPGCCPPPPGPSYPHPILP